MALNAMLLAVDAQSAALKSMDREHSMGIENSFSIDRLRGQVKDFVQSAHIIVAETEKLSLEQTREKIAALAIVARRLKADADRFRDASQPKAKHRYDHLLMQTGLSGFSGSTEQKPETVPADAPAGQAPTDTSVSHEPQKLTVQAGFACLRAEVDIYEAFTMQLHAVCNLALEYVLNAAAASARQNANI
jgi:hypothetical protein